MAVIWSWIAAAFELSGAWLVGNKRRVGFILNFVGCSVWLYVAISGAPAVGLVLVVVPAMFVNARNFVKWGRNESRNRKQVQEEQVPFSKVRRRQEGARSAGE